MKNWWRKGWDVNFQNIHWQESGVWCQGLFWPHPDSTTCVVLMHGSMANSHWWRSTAGYLAQSYQVFAPDFSGMGESGHRDHYSVSLHATEVARALEILEYERIITIGHSYGGYCGLKLANMQLAGHQAHILVDSPLAPLLNPASRSRRLKGRVNYYKTFDEIREHFRLVPHQPMPEQIIVEDIIAQSVCHDELGWRWKFDPSSMSGLAYDKIDLGQLTTPIHYISAKESAFYEQTIAQQVTDLGWGFSLIEDAYHAVMLDQPQKLYEQIQQLIGTMLK